MLIEAMVLEGPTPRVTFFTQSLFSPSLVRSESVGLAPSLRPPRAAHRCLLSTDRGCRSWFATEYNQGYTQTMKTAISIPEPLFDAAERAAERLGVSRSRLYARAVEAYLKAHRAKGVKEALDAVYASETSNLDPALAMMQEASLWREEW